MSNIKNSAYIYNISIISKNGDVVDLKNIFLEFNIYESMFTHFLSGDITLKDTSDIIKNLPIVGGEDVKISFRDSQNLEALYLDFVITSEPKQVELSTGKNKVQAIFLELSSKSSIYDKFQRISHKFKGDGFEIVSNMIGLYLRTSKTIERNVLNTSIEFVSNNWYPTQIIDYVCGQSKDALFFENTEFFIYDTISNLVKQENISELYLAKTFEQSTGINHVLAYNFDRKFDLEMSYMSFMFGQTVYKPNLEGYGFKKKSKSLNEVSGSELPLMGNNKLFQDVLSTKDNHIALTYQDIDSKLYRNMILQTLANYNLIIKVMGSSKRKIGKMVNFNLPSVDNSQALDSNFSGKWLITQIKHNINSSLEYTQNIRLWKNAFNNNQRV